MTLLDEGQMFLQLRSKMNIAQAQRVADYLNEHISSIGITLFENHPMFNATPRSADASGWLSIAVGGTDTSDTVFVKMQQIRETVETGAEDSK
jgi:hypothetical protein